jgi:hypothetical protein
VNTFKMAIEIIYFYCTQLVSTIDVLHHISEDHVRLVFYFSGPRPRALGVDHMIGVVPRTRLSDGCARGRDPFKDRNVRGLIPRTSIW